jgi:altronate dehydratase
MYARVAADKDLTGGDILEGVGIETEGAEIMGKIIAIASGRQALPEDLGLGGAEFLRWQIGAAL